MEYRKFDNVIVARIDKDEEILEQLKAIAIKENIKLASIQALGAINDFTVGVYKTDEKKYYSNSFQGSEEHTSELQSLRLISYAVSLDRKSTRLNSSHSV